MFESVLKSPSIPDVAHDRGATSSHKSRLVCDHRFRGCLFSCSYHCRTQAVPSVFVHGKDLSIQSSSLWLFHSPRIFTKCVQVALEPLQKEEFRVNQRKCKLVPTQSTHFLSLSLISYMMLGLPHSRQDMVHHYRGGMPSCWGHTELYLSTLAVVETHSSDSSCCIEPFVAKTIS